MTDSARPRAAEDAAAVRARALAKLPFAAVLAAVMGLALTAGVRWLQARGVPVRALGPGVPVVAGAAVAPLLVALAELVAGVRFGRMAASWRTLRPWQRGVLGAGIVAVALGGFGAIAFGVAVALTR